MEGADGKKGGGRGAEEERKKKEKAQKVPFLKLFTFTDFWDYVLMGIGSLGACAHSASIPVFFIFFGKLINIMGVAYLFPQSVSDKVGKVFAEVFRVLKPGGVFIVSFSNRMFYEKAISAWREAIDYGRIQLVVQYFQCVSGFTEPEVLRGMPRKQESHFSLKLD